VSEKIILEWEIECFGSVQYKPAEYIKSCRARFSTGTECWLVMFPNGDAEASKGSIDVFVYSSSKVCLDAELTLYKTGKTGTKPFTAASCSFVGNEIDAGRASGWTACPVSAIVLAWSESLFVKAELRLIQKHPVTALRLAMGPQYLTNESLQRSVGSDLFHALASVSPSDPGVLQLVADGGSLLAHSLVLASRSPVFAAMLSAEMTEKSNRVINIPDVKLDLLTVFIRCVYTDECDPKFLVENVFDLLQIADKYDFPRLLRLCEERIVSELSPESVFNALLAACRHNRQQLKQALLEYTDLKYEELFRTSQYQDILDNHSDIALDILKFRTAKARSAVETTA